MQIREITKSDVDYIPYPRRFEITSQSEIDNVMLMTTYTWRVRFCWDKKDFLIESYSWKTGTYPLLVKATATQIIPLEHDEKGAEDKTKQAPPEVPSREGPRSLLLDAYHEAVIFLLGEQRHEIEVQLTRIKNDVDLPRAAYARYADRRMALEGRWKRVVELEEALAGDGFTSRKFL